MSDYESGYDPKYGYNRNAFAHKTLPQAIIGKTVKLIVSPIGLISEAIHHHKDKKPSQSNPDVLAAATTAKPGSQNAPSPSEGQGDEPAAAYVTLPVDQADELIANNQAIPAEGETATHELVLEDDKDDGIARDEADWALDEAASDTEEKKERDSSLDGGKEEPVADIVPSMPPTYSAGPSKKAPSKLPFPVVLPQRRPGTKTRGFVRAYAPVLQDSDLDQETFLTFLKNFHKAAQASPIFDIVMIATGVMGLYPDVMIGAAVQAIQIAAKIGQEAQERWRTNKFLDQANREMFIPRGLYALIVMYKPGDSEQTEVGTKTVDLGATAMAKYGDALTKTETTDAEGGEQGKEGTMEKMKDKMKQLRIASGETHGEAEIPVTCAPLIFPALEAVAEAAEKESGQESVGSSIKAKSKSATKFVNDYYDRRAQAIYVGSYS